MNIQKTAVATLFSMPEMAELLLEYADECAIAGMPEPKPNVALYQQLEEVGVFHPFRVLDDDGQLIGFAGLLISQNPHYSELIGTVESIFIGKDHRSSGAGLALVRTIKRYAQNFGTVGLFSSAPTGGSLDEVYKRMDCAHTNNVYFWGLE